jgi:hypothetical protein
MLPIPEAKRVYRVEFAMHVELVWVREDVCVAITGLTGGYNACSFFNGLLRVNFDAPKVREGLPFHRKPHPSWRLSS